MSQDLNFRKDLAMPTSGVSVYRQKEQQGQGHELRKGRECWSIRKKAQEAASVVNVGSVA